MDPATSQAFNTLIASEEALKLKSRFLAAVSHDLRQPVHSLGMLAETLDAPDAGPEFAQRLGALKSCIATLSEMLNGMLDLSRFDMGVHHVSKTAVSLDWLMKEIEETFQAEAQFKGLQLSLHSNGLFALSDKHLLRRILFCLVANALKYTRQGQVAILCEARESTVTISVRDEGIGIPDEDLACVLDGHLSMLPTHALDQGLGVGLTVVKLAAELLDHKVTAFSTPGTGTTFLVELPLAPKTEEAPACEAAATPALNQEPLCVLLVENDVFTLESMRDVMTGWGYRVFAYSNPVSAIKEMQAGMRLDLILSDMHLNSSVSGLELITSVRRTLCDAPQVPAMLMTGDLGVELRDDMESASISVLYKPVRPSILKDILSVVLPLPG